MAVRTMFFMNVSPFLSNLTDPSSAISCAATHVGHRKMKGKKCSKKVRNENRGVKADWARWQREIFTQSEQFCPKVQSQPQI
jgi:hypothetical protein